MFLFVGQKLHQPCARLPDRRRFILSPFLRQKIPTRFFSKYICGHYLLKSFCSPVLLPATDSDHLERIAELEAAKREAEAIRTGPLYRPVRSK